MNTSTPGGADAWSVVALPTEPRSSEAAAEPLTLPLLEHGCADACLWSGWLAVADADGIDMSDPGDSVRVVDMRTGRQRMRLRIPNGMPAALGAWEDRLLVVDGASGDLLVFDCSGRLHARIRLRGVPVGSADLAVIR